MDRSELRTLALRYAEGGLDAAEYLRARTKLIDDITAGRQPIERTADDVVPPRATGPPVPEEVPGAAVDPGHRATGHLAGIPLWALMALAAALAGLGAWAILSGRAERALSDQAAPGRPPPAVAPVAPHRRLDDPVADRVHEAAQRPARDPALPAGGSLDAFLAAGDWSEESLLEYEQAWLALTPHERQRERALPAYIRLLAELERTLEAEQAVAALDIGADRARHLDVLVRFAAHLTDDRATPQAPSPPASPPEPGAGAAPADWFRSQPPGNFTLQLFASRRAASARRLVETYPALALRIHRSASEPTRFRVLQGSFPTAELARAAARELPPEVIGQTGKPLIRTFADLPGAELRP